MPLERLPKRQPPPSEWEIQNLGVMRLLLDDIQDCMNQLVRLKAGPVLRADGSVASDAESLKDATRKELRKVTIIACEGSVVVLLSRAKAEVWWMRAEPVAVTAAADCAALLRTKRLPGAIAFVEMFTRLVALFVLPGLGVGVVAVVTGAQSGGAGWRGLGIGVGIIVFLILAFSIATQAYRPYSSARIRPYFQRERRDITLSRRTAWLGAIAGAVLSTALGAALTWTIAKR